jgi:hypothetical protein
LVTTLCAPHGRPPEMSFTNRFEVFTHHLSSSQLSGKNKFLSMQTPNLDDPNWMNPNWMKS